VTLEKKIHHIHAPSMLAERERSIALFLLPEMKENWLSILIKA
jgi:hypothetical protein